MSWARERNKYRIGAEKGHNNGELCEIDLRATLVTGEYFPSKLSRDKRKRG